MYGKMLTTVVIIWIDMIHATDNSYCRSLYLNQDPPVTIVKVCQSNSGSGSLIYLDSTGAPVSTKIKCQCNILHDNRTNTIQFSVASNGDPGVKFKAKGYTFQNTSDSERVTFDKKGMIIFQQYLEKHTSLMCLSVSSTADMKIECVSVRDLARTTPPHSAGDTSSEAMRTNTNPSATTSATPSSTNTLHPELIVGVIAGGILLVVSTVVVILVCQRKSNKRIDEKSLWNKTIDRKVNAEYDMTINANYEPADPVQACKLNEPQDVCCANTNTMAMVQTSSEYDYAYQEPKNGRNDFEMKTVNIIETVKRVQPISGSTSDGTNIDNASKADAVNSSQRNNTDSIYHIYHTVT